MNLAGFKQDHTARSLSFFSEKKVSFVSPEIISELKKISVKNDGANVRLCLHASPEDLFHDMVILENKNARYYRPHCHLDKPETLHIIQGEATVLLFGNNGEIDQCIQLSFEGCPIIRINQGVFHTVVPAMDSVIYHESKPGPFMPESDSVFPDWAPDGSDSQVTERYIENLLIASKKK